MFSLYRNSLEYTKGVKIEGIGGEDESVTHCNYRK
jgi:hypothetical protein